MRLFINFVEGSERCNYPILFLCSQDYSKNYERILVEFCVAIWGRKEQVCQQAKTVIISCILAYLLHHNAYSL